VLSDNGVQSTRHRVSVTLTIPPSSNAHVSAPREIFPFMCRNPAWMWLPTVG
jgi:hypothetical protein